MFGNSLIHDENKYSIEKGKGIEERTPGTFNYISLTPFSKLSHKQQSWAGNKAILLLMP